jgi:hypothetical protein
MRETTATLLVRGAPQQTPVAAVAGFDLTGSGA